MGRRKGSLGRRYAGMTLADRVRTRLVETSGPLDTPCRIWTGAVSSNGYGHISDLGNGPNRLVHRVVYEDVHGPVPAGLELHHRCETPLCAADDHLVAVTHVENVRRGRRWRRVGESASRVRGGDPFTASEPCSWRTPHKPSEPCSWRVPYR